MQGSVLDLIWRRSMDGLPRNARNSILTEPLWGIFATPLLYYAPLYMSSVGLSTTQIGLLELSLVQPVICADPARTGRAPVSAVQITVWPLVPESEALSARGALIR